MSELDVQATKASSKDKNYESMMTRTVNRVKNWVYPVCFVIIKREKSLLTKPLILVLIILDFQHLVHNIFDSRLIDLWGFGIVPDFIAKFLKNMSVYKILIGTLSLNGLNIIIGLLTALAILTIAQMAHISRRFNCNQPMARQAVIFSIGFALVVPQFFYILIFEILLSVVRLLVKL